MLFPRFSTYTVMPAATERRTHDALIVPVPPMYRTLRSWEGTATFAAFSCSTGYSGDAKSGRGLGLHGLGQGGRSLVRGGRAGRHRGRRHPDGLLQVGADQ